MNLKISLLSVVIMSLPLCSQAQTARNPLNFEPAQMALQKRISSWKLSEEIFYRTDGTPFDKRSFLYDENGQKTAEITLRWNKVDKTWHNTEQCEYLFETNREILINKSGEQYITKTEIVSDAEGKPAYSLTYQWNNLADDWSNQPYLRCEWMYDGNGRVTTYQKQHKNRETNEWYTFNIRILYSYDKNGFLMEELFQAWNYGTDQWTNRGKYNYLKISEQQKTAYSYIYASDSWVSDGKTVYFYDENAKITRCDYYKNEADQTPNAYSINTYSEIAPLRVITESSAIKVFPNPVVSSFEMTIPNEYVGKTMHLFDAWGKPVKTIPITKTTTQTDVSGLSNGIYLLKIGGSTQKIIIQ